MRARHNAGHNKGMQPLLTSLAATLNTQAAVLVRVQQAQGSVPREQGAMMAVTATAQLGTLGGGRLEWEAAAHAREMLKVAASAGEIKRFSLGPSLGQCCGGVVHLAFEFLPAGTAWPTRAARALAAGQPFDVPSTLFAQRLHAAPFHISLFGGGHVGHALIDVLSRLPCRISWIDSRDEIFPDELPANVRTEHSAPVQAAARDLSVAEAGTHVLIMSFSHAEDLEIVAACLDRQNARGDLPYIGLIGSKTKWATFRARLKERGYSDDALETVTCPIGLPGIAGKEPELIALAVAAQLMTLRKIS
jgi:xanthine dehydrogenase accessory factor